MGVGVEKGGGGRSDGRGSSGREIGMGKDGGEGSRVGQIASASGGGKARVGGLAKPASTSCIGCNVNSHPPSHNISKNLRPEC